MAQADGSGERIVHKWPPDCYERLGTRSKEFRYRRKRELIYQYDQAKVAINERLAKMGETHLTQDELVAARLRTGPMGTLYNQVLRAKTTEANPPVPSTRIGS